MVMIIRANNVNGAFADVWWRMKGAVREENSRNGKVVVFPEPVITSYKAPQERVLFNPVRDANPVFHLVEALWMLDGRNDVASLLPYNSKYGQYAETDGTVHGAYGYRWRQHFDVDQLWRISFILKSDPTSRQAVLTMWDPDFDLTHAALKDRPCNTQIYFDVRGGCLNMTVCCRSNDIVWGAYGANVVHFSILQEWLAADLNVPIGTYHQFSNNFHAYTDLPIVRHLMAWPPQEKYDYYQEERVTIQPLVAKGEETREFLWDCEDFFAKGASHRTAFFRQLVNPLVSAYHARHVGTPAPVDPTDTRDWMVAFREWCERRENAKSK